MDLDEFSDDGFDDLPDNALQELENRAITFTQAQQQNRGTPQPPLQPHDGAEGGYSDLAWEDDDDLDTSEVINQAGPPVGRPPVDNSLPKQPPSHNQPALARRPPPPNPQWNPNIGSVHRGNPDALPARSQFPASSQRLSTLGQPEPSQFARPPLPQRYAPSQQQPSSQFQQHPDGVFAALQQRVRALEAELNVARGEVSITRANSKKQDQEHSAEVARLKRLNAEQVARQERMVEAAVAAEKTASTELQFLQQDMREVRNQPKRKTSDQNNAGQRQGTPGKRKTWAVADGFDGMEIASPSKGQGRSRNAGTVAQGLGERTPSKNKRKRPTVDSPVMALETHTDDVVMIDPESTEAPPEGFAPTAAPAPLFEFLQIVLDHASFYGESPTFDMLSRFSFPSDPGTSLSTHIFQALPIMGDRQRPMQLLVDFAAQVVLLWSRSFAEEAWDPIKYLVALLAFTLHLQTTYVAPYIAVNLAPVAQATIRKLAEGRHRLPDGDLSKNQDYAFLEQHVDTTNILSLLYATALACVTYIPEADNDTGLGIADFWRLISLDFVTVLLTPKQMPDDIVGMLDLLTTSSLPESIGPVLEDKEPAFVARPVIERVSAKLTEPSLAAMSPHQKRLIQISALRTMVAFSRHPFGALQLASHGNALPRIVTCLSASIDSLYDLSIPSHILPPPADDSSPDLNTPSAMLYRIIAQCVLLIHTLVTDPRTSETADIQQKLSMSYGGSQRYLIALGRLTFAEEDLVMEAGIEGEVVEMAHELLELIVTPDEGEIVSEAFGA